MKPLSLFQLARRSGMYFIKSHLAVGLGIAAATAVIVGALVVGDSVRGSLRGLVLQRLVNVQFLLHARSFFDPGMIESLSLQSLGQTGSASTANQPAANQQAAGPAALPLIFLPSATVEHRQSVDSVLRSSQVQIFGVDDRFWGALPAADAPLPPRLEEDEIALGRGLADELKAHIGDELTLRLEAVGGVPNESPLGKRDDTSVNLPRQKIVAILPDRGVGGLSFQSTQMLPRNVFCNLQVLQDALECEAQVNAALVVSQPGEPIPSPLGRQAAATLNVQLRPRIEDYGLNFERITLRFPDSDEPIYDYYQLTSDALILDDAVANVLYSRFSESSIRLMTYLGNSLAKVAPRGWDLSPRYRSTRGFESEPQRLDSADVETQWLSRPVPYSIVVGVDGADERLLEQHTSVPHEELRSPYCWINSWLADQIEAEPKDWLEIRFYAPETVDGVEQELSVRCMIAGVVPLTEPAEGYRRNRPARYTQPPTLFNDPHMTPHVPGLTDKDSIANWEAPFPLDLDLIQPADDAYYENHRLTPKVFLPFHIAASERMFGSRFGHTTAIRFPADQFPDEEQLRSEIEQALLITRPQHGLTFQPVRYQLLSAATGTTPFDMLFLSLSFFVIVAALTLVALLFKLGITQRASQLGLLAAAGFAPRRIRGVLLRELSGVALAGAAVGILLGLFYARLMIAGLQSWWVGAINNPFLSFSFTPTSLALGAVVGLVISLLTIYISLRKLSRVPPLRLLRGQTETGRHTHDHYQPAVLAIAGFIGVGGVGLIVAALGQSGMARAGSFFGSGMLLLLAGLLATHQLLRSRGRLSPSPVPHTSLLALAWSAVYRNPLRSSLALSLLSVASFLIASMSIFHISPDPRGYGGFDWMGQSSTPIYRNIGSTPVREAVLGKEMAAQLRDTYILAFRVRPGEDASCNNLFQVAQPTILGVPPRLGQLSEFGGADTAFQWSAADNPQNPWQALEQPAVGDEQSPIPVIIDQNTAAWSLKQGAQLGGLTKLQYGARTLVFQTVGLLSNSVLQGKLMIGQANFQLLFPDISGSQFFLIRSGQSTTPERVRQVLEQGWSTEGLALTSSAQTLASLLEVQNTYLSAFQSLGALGLLLGTFGLIAVQLRSVVERRHELALMQAVGFAKSRIAWMLTLETGLLLGGGLLIGCLAAGVALVPYLIENGTPLSALQPLAMLAVILAVGFLAALIAVRAALRRSILEGLRSE